MEAELGAAITSTLETASMDARVTAYGWKALAGSVIGYSMDGFDLLILSFMLTAISADLSLTKTQAGSLITWTLVGAAQNVLFNIGRALGAPGPLAVGALAAKFSFSVAIALLASIYVLDIVVTVFLIPELKGQELT
jgi:hypothetical protein